jgi:hypothetical protein
MLTKTNIKTKLLNHSVYERDTDDSSPEDEPEERYSVDEGEGFNFTVKEMFDDISTLYSLCAESMKNKYLSTLMCVTLRHLGYSRRQGDSLVSNVGEMTARTYHKHSLTFLNNDIDEFCANERGGKQSASFYDL